MRAGKRWRIEINNLFIVLTVVCSTAFLGFFSQEFSRFLKKIFAIKGTKLFLPLGAASWFVVVKEDLALDFLKYIDNLLNLLNQWLIDTLPEGQYTANLILVGLLSGLSILPVVLLNIHYYRKTYKPYPHPYLLSSIIWIIAGALMISVPALYGK